MPYIPPPVQLGLQEITLPNGQKVRVPKAFMNRILFDLQASNQFGANAVGSPIFPEEMMGHYFGGGVRGERGRVGTPEQTGRYTAYGFDPNFMGQLSKAYSGSGLAVQHTTPYQQQQAMAMKMQKQQEIKKQYAPEVRGEYRRIEQTAAGQVLSDTGETVRQHDLRQFEGAISEKEREMQRAMMEDLHQFQKAGQTSTISNVPIVVTRSDNPNIRSSMAMQLGKLGALAT